MKPTRLWQANLPAHPTISSLSLARELLGTRVKVQLRDGRVRSKLLLFFYPDDPRDFSYSSGRFFLDVKPPRAAKTSRTPGDGSEAASSAPAASLRGISPRGIPTRDNSQNRFLRLYWHDFESGRPLKAAGDIFTYY